MAEIFDTSRPIYLQIVERITHKIIAGEYPLGERLASVRDLAAEFGVNPNTMQRALAELERQGLVYTERTAGRFVTAMQERVDETRDEVARQVVADFMGRMAQMGYQKEQMLAVMSAMLDDSDCERN